MTALLAHLMQAAGQGTVYVSDENARYVPLPGHSKMEELNTVYPEAGRWSDTTYLRVH